MATENTLSDLILMKFLDEEAQKPVCVKRSARSYYSPHADNTYSVILLILFIANFNFNIDFFLFGSMYVPPERPNKNYLETNCSELITIWL